MVMGDLIRTITPTLATKWLTALKVYMTCIMQVIIMVSLFHLVLHRLLAMTMVMSLVVKSRTAK
jgi:hypothetical protein